MNFTTIFEFLKTGNKIRRKGWKGYWILENSEVIMYCAQTPGSNELTRINIKDTNDIMFTLSNIAAEDWELALE